MHCFDRLLHVIQVAMQMTLKTWLWPTLGLIAGCGCGWAWRSAGHDRTPDASLLGLPAATTSIAVGDGSALATAKSSSDKAAFSVPHCEAELRKALASDDLGLSLEWARALVSHDAVLALRIVSDSTTKRRDTVLYNIIFDAARADPTLIRLALLGATFALGFGITAWPESLAKAWHSAFPMTTTASPTSPPAHASRKPIAVTTASSPASLAEALRKTLATAAGPARDAAMRKHSEALDKLPAETALRMLLALPASSTRDTALGNTLRRLAREDPGSAIDWLAKEPALRRFSSDMSSALATIAAKDGPQAWALYKVLLAVDPTAYATSLIETWTKANGPQAASAGLTSSDAVVRKAFLQQAYRV